MGIKPTTSRVLLYCCAITAAHLYENLISKLLSRRRATSIGGQSSKLGGTSDDFFSIFKNNLAYPGSLYSVYLVYSYTIILTCKFSRFIPCSPHRWRGLDFSFPTTPAGIRTHVSRVAPHLGSFLETLYRLSYHDCGHITIYLLLSK